MRCNFDKLVQYLDRELDVDEQLEVLEHIDECEVCRDVIYEIARDRDAEFFRFVPYKEPVSVE